MKNDARLLLNKKKWKNTSGNNKTDGWDARKILNFKRSRKTKPTVLGSYMRTKSATALIAEQIKKEIYSDSKVPNKHVKLSKDGNIIVTSKSKNLSQVVGKREVAPKLNIGMLLSSNRSIENTVRCQPSTSMEDLEHTALEDFMDLDSLPPAYVAPKSLQSAYLSRSSALNQILNKGHTMVADQFSEQNKVVSSKVCVSNLHPTVSRQDVMELFGDIGAIKSIEMVMAGAAIIEFFNEDDAVKACEIYHNRLLDGLPMKCYLQRGSALQKFAVSQRLGNRSETNFHSTFLPPVVYNPRSRYNPHNVQFTVKLP